MKSAIGSALYIAVPPAMTSGVSSVRSALCSGIPARSSMFRMAGKAISYPTEKATISKCVIASPDSSANSGMCAARISSSMSPHGANTRSHQTPGISFITP